MNDFEVIFKYAGVGIALVSKTGHVIKANPALLKFLVTTEEQLVGKNFVEVTHPDDIEKDVFHFEQLVSGEIDTYTIEKRYKINGHFIWGLLTVAAVENRDYVIAEVQNIADIKVAQTELKNFAYAASHDLREPLRIINGYAYMISSAAQNLPPTFEHYVNHMVNAANRMSEMIDGLLAYSRINNDKDYKKISIYEAFQLAKNNLSTKILETNTQVSFDGNGFTYGVKGQIAQLFQNLIDNAIKYKHPDKNPKIEIKVVDKKPFLSIQIKDNGIGIPENNHTKIFQIFKQLHPDDAYEGRGIGLALVKQIIDHNKGHIWLKSKPDCGTTFFVSLPSYEGE